MKHRYRNLRDFRPGQEVIIWRAEDQEKSTWVTVKEPRPELAEEDRPRVLRNIAKEYEFLATLQHERILPTRQWHANWGAVYGDSQGPLTEWLTQYGKLDPGIVATVLHQCLEALIYLHGRKLAHGCLCPDALVVSPTSDILLAPFVGYSFPIQEALPAADYPLKYHAPELVSDRWPKDKRPEVAAAQADLYSLGFLALELLTGTGLEREIFPSGMPPEVAQAWTRWHTGDSKLPDLRLLVPNAPAGLLDFLGKLVNKTPTARQFLSIAQAQVALGRAGLRSASKLPSLGGAGPSEPGRGLVTPAAPPVRKKRQPLELLTLADNRPVCHFLCSKTAVIGQHQASDLILKEAEVSNKHALFACHADGTWWVYDLKSRTGVLRNGHKKPAHRLKERDIVQLGTQQFRVHYCETLGEFTLDRLIHEGSNGKLYRGRWIYQDDELRRPDKKAIIRVFPTEFQFDEEAIGRLQRLAETAANFRHERIVRYFKGGMKGKEGPSRRWYLGMEYLSRGSLRDRLEGGTPLPVADIVRFGQDICEALAEVQRHGMVHRNINPSCILFDSHYRAKLGDFFMLRETEGVSLRQITQIDMTPVEQVYQAPEQFTGETHQLTIACDLYSLAACMYEALSGKPPFDPGQTSKQIVNQIVSQAPPRPRELNSAIPVGLESLLLRTLSKSPRDRPASPTELQKELSRLLEG